MTGKGGKNNPNLDADKDREAPPIAGGGAGHRRSAIGRAYDR